MPAPAEVSLPSATTIEIVRTFAAPRPLVFRAFTRPELVRRWLLGPPGWTMPVCEIDLRPGGHYRYRWSNEAEGKSFGLEGAYEAIDPDNRLVIREHFEDVELKDEARITTVFTDAGLGTRVAYTIEAESQEARDAALKTGMTDGMEMSFSALDRLLAAERGVQANGTPSTGSN